MRNYIGLIYSTTMVITNPLTYYTADINSVEFTSHCSIFGQYYRACVCVCVWIGGRRINRCGICHGDICVPWRSSRSPLYLCNLQLSALTSLRPPLAPTTRPACPKGLGYKFKRVRKIERGKGLECRSEVQRELEEKGELKESVVVDIKRN